MIKRLRLSQWRAFEQLDLELDRGVTFIVAQNGIGKTSTVLGLRWGLFGDLAGIDPAQEARHNRDETRAAVSFSTPDGRLVEVDRRWRSRARPRTEVQVSIDGRKHGGEPELRELLKDAFGVDPALLANLSVLVEGRVRQFEETTGDLLRKHLAEALGVDQLKAAAEESRRLAREAGKLTRAVRNLDLLDTTEREQTQERISIVTTQLAVLEEQQREYTGRLATAKVELNVADQWADYHDLVRDREAAEEVILADIRDLLSTDDQGGDVGEALTAAENELRRRLDAQRTRLAELSGQESLIETLIEQLSDADASCPVCLRPLDEQTLDHAHSSHRERLASIQAERRTLDPGRESEVELEHIRQLRQRWSETQRPSPPREPRPKASSNELREHVATLQEEVERIAGKVAERREEMRLLQARLEDDENTRRAREELRSAFRRQALAEAAEETFEKSAQDIIEQHLDPWTSALRAPWQQLVYGMGELEFRPDGSLLTSGETALDLRQLSGGQQAIAGMLTHLLVLVASSRARLLWVDEPLEHLDPRNRRRLAATLVRSVQEQEMDQIVVTTYEETLARRLAETHPSTARVIYVTDG